MPVVFKSVDLFQEGDFAYLSVTGKLEKKDYEMFAPEIDKQVEKYKKINMMVELKDFQGWTAGAAWEDTKFGIKHFNDIEKLAIVGDSAWEKGMAYFAKPFTTAKVRYFDVTERSNALSWLDGM